MQSDDAPVCGSGVVASEERVLTNQSYGTDRAFHGIAAHVDAAVSRKQAQSIPVFAMYLSASPRGALADSRARLQPYQYYRETTLSAPWKSSVSIRSACTDDP